MSGEPKTLTPQRFRKKPVVIEAMRFDGTERSQAAIVNWGDGRISGWFDDRYCLEIRTLEGTMRADVGDWIIRGVQGEFYPCKPDIFEATYEPADTPERDDDAELRADAEWSGVLGEALGRCSGYLRDCLGLFGHDLEPEDAHEYREAVKAAKGLLEDWDGGRPAPKRDDAAELKAQFHEWWSAYVNVASRLGMTSVDDAGRLGAVATAEEINAEITRRERNAAELRAALAKMSDLVLTMVCADEELGGAPYTDLSLDQRERYLRVKREAWEALVEMSREYDNPRRLVGGESER